MPPSETLAGKPTSYTTDFIKADTHSAVFLGNPHIDNLMTVVIALGAEIWSDRQRQRIIETLLAKHGRVTPQMIDAYVPSEAEKQQWAAERDSMVKRVYSVLQRDASNPASFGMERGSGGAP